MRRPIFWKLWPHLFFASPHIFANEPHLVTLTWRLATKTRSKLPRCQFPPKRRLFPCVYLPFHLDPSWPRTNLYLFPSNGLKSKKKSVFFTNLCVRPQKYLWQPIASSILMPPTFHIASLNHFTPKFSGVPQKLTRYYRFGLQNQPKWGYSKSVSAQKGLFKRFFWGGKNLTK